VKLGIVLPLFTGDPDRVLERAQRAEELGFDGVFAFDHFFPPGAPPDKPSLEVFSTLAGVAAVTQRLAMGTLVARVTLRPVGMLAKLATSIDEMSGGRMILAAGTGDALNDAESAAFGFATPAAAERRALLEEAVAACRALFAGEPFPGGRHVPAIAGPLRPPPPTPGGPPIWVGGTSEATIRLAGRIADAWNGWGLDESAFASKASILRQAAAEAGRSVKPTWAGLALVGRDRSEVSRLVDERRGRPAADALQQDVWAGTREDLLARLRAFEDAGADWGILMLAGPADRIDLVAELLAELRG
jgi:alkanesulfonate monooxygenase SsuD/methylene tetrahydromethanopterin reductase-like flavin-dependent oxidoreductase (luciferase family)